MPTPNYLDKAFLFSLNKRSERLAQTLKNNKRK